MALASCRDCGREVSSNARACVHCGRPWPSSNCGGAAVVAGILLAVLLVGGALWCCRFRKLESRAPQQIRAVEAPLVAPAVRPGK